MSIGRIGRHEVLLQINHNRYDFRKKKNQINLFEKGLLILIIQKKIITIFEGGKMQSLKTAFVTKMKREIKKKTKITRAKRLLSNKKSFRRSSVNQSSNQPGVTAKE